MNEPNLQNINLTPPLPPSGSMTLHDDEDEQDRRSLTSDSEKYLLENHSALHHTSILSGHIKSLDHISTIHDKVDHYKYAKDALVQFPIDYIHTDTFMSVPQLSSAEFLAVVDSVNEAIKQSVFPKRISQGSSGSYFCRNPQGEIVGVFKPKNEEPYGHLNPKWTKWIHKNLFPCCFGRSCLIPNLGYTSEAGASFVDRKLELFVCPRTEIVSLASPSFYYSSKDRHDFYYKNKPLPLKIGSFQIFLRGYIDATTFFRDGYSKMKPARPIAEPELSSISSFTSYTKLFRNSFSYTTVDEWTARTQKEFQWGFERLVILDYLIRNTDRGSDNWMIRYDTATKTIKKHDDNEVPVEDMDEPTIHVAVIDNGLAFPWKHPDQWRSYPYGWATLPCAQVTFSQETREFVLHLLTSQEWWHELFEGLERIFRLDPDFSPKIWKLQKAVMRGQGYNLVEVLRRSELGDSATGSPAALIQRPCVAVFEEEDNDGNDGFLVSSKRKLKKLKQSFQSYARNQPWFTFC